MLTPEYLNSFSSGYLGMCDVLNEQIIRDVARRIAKTGRITPTAEWQLKQAKQSGALMDDVIREVGVLTGKSDTEILRLFQDAGLSGMLQDAKPLLQAGKLKTSNIVLSGAMQRTMEAAAEKCRGEGILSGVLAEVRSNAANELADDTARYEEELKEYYETEAKEKQETFEKEKEELITLFENPEEAPDASEESVAGEEPVIEEVE